MLEKNNYFEIDYCSIDTEGVEEQIIKSIDFNRFNIKSFTIENNNKSNSIRLYLKEKGYICVPSIIDDFFFKKDNPRIKQTMLKILLYKIRGKFLYRLIR